DTGSWRFGVGFTTPSAHKDEAFQLLRLAVAAPRFDDEPIERGRREAMAQIEAATKDPGSVGSLVLRRRLYGKYRMSDWDSGTIEGLRNVGRADIEDYRRRIMARDTIKIAVVGDIDARTLAPLLDHIFGNLPAKADLRPIRKMEGGSDGCQAIEMDIPQSIVQFGNLTARLDWRQNLISSVLTSILSEAFTGRLFIEMREKRGLVYGIGTNHGNYLDYGLFSGGFGAASDNASTAMALTVQELRRIVAEAPTAQEVADAKQSLTGRILLGLDTSGKLANLVLAMQVNNIPITYLDDIAGEIAKITVEDVWNLAKLLIKPDRLAVTMVGKPVQGGACEKAMTPAPN
ncbi:MAG: M16 family metallopeptidase, partial [Hyphomicrobiaceae bacterium]